MKQQSAMPKPGASKRSKFRHGASAAAVPSITNAAVAHSEEMHHRMVKYATTMGIRMVCLASIFIFDGWFKVIPIIGAVVLPWVAVMIANAGTDFAHQENIELLDDAPLYAVGAGDLADDDVNEVLAGEIVDDEDETANTDYTAHRRADLGGNDAPGPFDSGTPGAASGTGHSVWQEPNP